MATSDRFPQPQKGESTRKPEWLKVRMPHGEGYERVKGIVRQLDGALDLTYGSGGTPTWRPAASLGLNDIGRVRLALASPLPVDSYREHRATGAFILVDEADGWTLGAGMAGSNPLPAVSPAPPAHPESGLS